jgi:DNA-binding HxlR family transcriptional regulator
MTARHGAADDARAEAARSVSQLDIAGPRRQNAIAVAFGVIGDEWNLLIVRSAIVAGASRYNQWRDRLGIANSVLTARLERLTALGIFERVPYQDRPVRHEYRLTAAGHDLWRVLLTIWTWELNHGVHALPIERMHHRTCGQPLVVVLTCAACGEPAWLRDVKAEAGPAGGDERSVPVERTRRRSAATVTGPGLFPETMALIGNRWSLAMLAAAFLGARRFIDFEQRLGAPPTMVSDRLRTFCDLGVLAPVATTERADRNQYHLTRKGGAYFPVLMASIDWGQRWFPDPEGSAMHFHHLTCGQPFVPRLACQSCQAELHSRDVIVDHVPRRRGRSAASVGRTWALEPQPGPPPEAADPAGVAAELDSGGIPAATVESHLLL